MTPDTIDRLSRRVYAGLRTGSPSAPDVVALACELIDQGYEGKAAREAMEEVPARMPAAELSGLAARLLAETGFDPGFDLAPERLEVLRHALRLTARDLPLAGVLGPPRLVVLKDTFPPAAGVVLADGRRLNGGLQAPTGDDPTCAVAAMARHVQEELMDRTREVWPVCTRHGLGAHAVVHEDSALWWCAQGHSLAPIGRLPSQ
ncbi:hypothetical protein [Streptomyces sp. NPDC048442]|uniref:hypothetical protein n=1 Tax=Streptomyces sp. NPDC048442 TaxID=3154823 RepID=UPI00341D0B30